MIRFLYYLLNKLLMLERISVEEHQRVLLYKKGHFIDLLKPGHYHFFNISGELTYETFDTNVLEFKSKYADVLIKKHSDAIERSFLLVDVADHQVAVISVDGKIYKALPPGTRQLFWKEIHELSVEYVDISKEYEVPPALTQALLRIQSEQVLFQIVPESHLGLLFLDGKYIKRVEPGVYLYWRAGRKIALDILDTRLQQIDVSGQEILTKDRVSLRLTLTCSYKISDPLPAKTQVSNYSDYLYKEVQFGIREAVSARTLDELLAEKEALNGVVFEYVKETFAAIGIEVKAIGVKDIILPGDMREIMNKVIEAKKLAEANQIKRREETAATRSLLNTAKLMESNPTLMRLKELETLEKVSEKISSLNLYGGFDGLLNEALKLRRPGQKPEEK
ncbi:MAG: slipin family protein [bacterium]|nr:slipin family protein [bacterium]